MTDKFLILTDYDILYGKDGYSISSRGPIDESKCFNSEEDADDAADSITDHSYSIINISEMYPSGTVNCPHCERKYEHQHIIDRKGYVHSTTLKGIGK